MSSLGVHMRVCHTCSPQMSVPTDPKHRSVQSMLHVYMWLHNCNCPRTWPGTGRLTPARRGQGSTRRRRAPWPWYEDPSRPRLISWGPVPPVELPPGLEPRQNGFALEPGARGFFDSESNLPRLKSTHVADCKPQAPPGRRWDFALELGLGLFLQNIREPAGWLRS